MQDRGFAVNLILGNGCRTAGTRLLGVACAALLAFALMACAVGCQARGNDTDEQAGSSQSQSAAEAGSESAGAESSSTAAVQDEEPTPEFAVFDDFQNPTFAALIELDGSALLQQLEAAEYDWDESGASWYRQDDGAMLFAQGPNGTLSQDETASLKPGAVNKDASYVFTAQGYGSPAEALTALAAETVVDRRLDSESASFAVATGSDERQYLLAVVKDGRGGHIGITFSDDSIAAGMFEQLIGADAGNSISKAWEYCKSVF